MRVLLDECLPRRLIRDLSGDHQVTTVSRQGWAGYSDSQLLKVIAGEFDVWITMDANLPFQQVLHEMPFALIILRSPSNRYEELRESVPEILRALSNVKPGEIVTVTSPLF